MTTSGINKETGIGCRMVQQTIAHWKKHGQPSSSHGNCGRHSIINERDRCSLKRIVKKDHHASVQIISSVFNQCHKRLSPCIMHRELKKYQFNQMQSNKKTTGVCCKHLEFARTHQNWTVENWKQVMWSDLL